MAQGFLEDFAQSYWRGRHRLLGKTRYELRARGTHLDLTVTAPEGELPDEFLESAASGHAELIAIESDGSERVVCGKEGA